MASQPKMIEAGDLEDAGREMHRLAADLYPICRSITGDGVRDTLNKIEKLIPLRMCEVSSGTQVFDWTVPQEWNIQEAYIKAPDGQRVVDFRKHSLHILNYSIPIHTSVNLNELRNHLYTLPEHPDWIPYRTSYYKAQWGFCMAHKEMLSLKDGEYEVRIESTLQDGHLTYGECYLPGLTDEEVLVSVHICHPSLANDNLSGLVVATFLARHLSKRNRRLSYRFLFIPGTIGAITWLAANKEKADRIRHGLVLTCLGDASGFHYKKSRRGDAEIDRAAAHVLKHSGESSQILDFSPYGYDERQYCSPGFDLPVGCLMRSVWGTFPEYHSSADNLEFIHAEKLASSLRICLSIIDVLEHNQYYLNQNPYCEPQLGKRGLYSTTGGASINDEINARLWVLNLSDGNYSLLDIAERSGLPFKVICDAAEILTRANLLAPIAQSGAAV
jgi:aminopeptidase-like protein